MSLKKKKLDALLVVAHPDDEAIFFSGLILSKKINWHVLCVTDGNADNQGHIRLGQFEKSCKALGVKKSECLHYKDEFGSRLEVERLIADLSSLPKYKTIYTHGILGEYGHPHHQDISYAVHKAFGHRAPVFSPAYNCYPEFSVKLTAKMYEKKTKILWDIYSDEIKRFLNFIPATSYEGFIQADFKEVEMLYFWLRDRSAFDSKKLRAYRWLKEYLLEGGGNLDSRPF